MKTRLVRPPCFSAALVAITLSFALPGASASDGILGDLPQAVRYELGKTQFAPGDNITIQSLHGTSDTIVTGGTYCVEGTYALASQDHAVLPSYTTTISINPTPID